MNAAPRQVIARNRRVFHDYEISERLEAGIVLTGSEVKSLRAGAGASIAQSFAAMEGGRLSLRNATIAAYAPAARDNHRPGRPRILLLRRRELARIDGLLRRQGYSLLPLELYFSPRGLAKLDLALARGRRKADRRQHEKAKDWKRRQAQLLRGGTR